MGKYVNAKANELFTHSAGFFCFFKKKREREMSKEWKLLNIGTDYRGGCEISSGDH